MDSYLNQCQPFHPCNELLDVLVNKSHHTRSSTPKGPHVKLTPVMLPWRDEDNRSIGTPGVPLNGALCVVWSRAFDTCTLRLTDLSWGGGGMAGPGQYQHLGEHLGSLYRHTQTRWTLVFTWWLKALESEGLGLSSTLALLNLSHWIN